MGNINQRLNGLNPLAYLGVNATQPPEVVIYQREPIDTDIEFQLGTLWLIPHRDTSPSEQLWTLIDLSMGTATWRQLYPGSGGGVQSVVAGNSISVTGTATNPIVNVDGLTNHAVQIGNINNTLFSLPVGATGQVLTGVTGSDPVWAAVPSDSITITGNAGTPLTGNSFIFSGGTSGAVFTGSGTTMTESFNFLSLPLTTSTNGQIRINSNAVFHTYGVTPADKNTFAGVAAGNFTLSGAATNNTGMGASSLASLTDGAQNAAFGVSSLSSLTDGSFNSAFGYSALAGITTGSNNNTAVGYNAGQALTAGDSGNTLIGAGEGISGDINTIRIGTQTAQLCYVGGIDGVNVGNTAQIVTLGTGGTANQLGSAVITAGTGIVVTPTANTITINATASPGFLGFTAIDNTDSPYTVLSDDEYISANSTAGTITVRLPNAPTVGRIFTIKDAAGTSATNNITITTVGGAVLIDGATSFVMNTNYESTSLLFNGAAYEIY